MISAQQLVICTTDEESFRSAPPVFGQHTAQVLRDFGLSDDEVAHLLDQRAVYQADDEKITARASRA